MNFRGSRGGCSECKSLDVIFDDFHKFSGEEKPIGYLCSFLISRKWGIESGGVRGRRSNKGSGRGGAAVISFCKDMMMLATFIFNICLTANS